MTWTWLGWWRFGMEYNPDLLVASTGNPDQTQPDPLGFYLRLMAAAVTKYR